MKQIYAGGGGEGGDVRRVEERAEKNEGKEWKREKCRIFCYARPVSLILCLPEKCV